MLASPLSVTMAFQSTHPRGVRLVKSRHAVRQILISIHAPTWGATGLQSERHCSYGISIHAPTWGATVADGIIPHRTIFQSTHPRGVRHYTTRLKKDSTSISIHAPTWGATRKPGDGDRSGKISIHAPTWGATQLPRLDEGHGQISIHAPTWGAT